MENFKHYLAFAGAIFLGAVLRFAFLDYKAIWLDEAITALFSLGRSYQDIPLNSLFSLHQLQEIFTLNPESSCGQIADNLARQSTHPPLFFCLIHYWLSLVGKNISPASSFWLGELRALPAFFGVLLIPVVYCLSRVAFSPKAGLVAAFFTAVSPFGVYLSQEARHYTLPMLLISVSLLCFICIQNDLFKERPVRLWLAAIWALVNTVGFYVHYFFILAFFAQIWILYKTCKKLKIFPDTQSLITNPLLYFCLLPLVLFLPWVPVLLVHFGRPDSGWIPTPQNIEPFYQTLAGWLVMAIVLPVERQPVWVIIPCTLLMIFYAIWLGKNIFFSLNKLGENSQKHRAAQTLISFIFWVLLSFFFIVYLLQKDITVAPRYNFVYYPAICALLGGCLSLAGLQTKKQNSQKITLIVIVVGIISSYFVIADLAFKKSFYPCELAEDIIHLEPATPKVIAMAYKDYQDVALGLSFGLEIHRHWRDKTPEIFFAFLPRKPLDNQSLPAHAYQIFWQSLTEIKKLPAFPLNLWVIVPQLEPKDYPQTLLLSDFQPQQNCLIDRNHYYNVGVPYQLYRCKSEVGFFTPNLNG
ncbi:glycosyltransferase family 39 protein [Ancylothrix sp. C2]|uniref:glycosyltransferase family 39 protein n=1 Tax=Ancylothrix sp. D3o TaxID=2953691 RepID=UPI0021BA914C|nr:glycosyltransferase family 39 protein [Ancylothrix sp. D3o]MCT7948930.1 glycosyltransferase family 39 protein [Ancylothrix sp. D3o]